MFETGFKINAILHLGDILHDPARRLLLKGINEKATEQWHCYFCSSKGEVCQTILTRIGEETIKGINENTRWYCIL